MQEDCAALPPWTRFENIVPILRVESLLASIDYYLNALGFAVDWQDGSMASVSRDGHAIMLCEGAQGSPGAWVWIGVEDAQSLYTEYVTRGASIILAPVNYPWAYEMRVADPDGHVLRFGSGPRADLPTA
jgi:Glyoxalase superfamily protein